MRMTSRLPLIIKNSVRCSSSLVPHNDMTFKVLFKSEQFATCGGNFHDCGIPRSQVRVDFNANYNVKFETQTPAEDPISQQIWVSRKSENPTLFNGTKFRFHAVEKHEQPRTLDIENNSQHIEFKVGLCDYRSFLCTNAAPSDRFEHLMNLGYSMFNDPRAFVADPIGISCVVTTIDEHIVLIRRSENCGELPGYFDFPGGHPEPKAIGLEFSFDEPGSVEKAITTFKEQGRELSLETRDELFNAAIDELVAEINIPRSGLSEPRLAGVYQQNHTNGRPSILFAFKTTLTTDNVKELYLQGGEEADESTSLLVVPIETVKCKHGICTEIHAKTGIVNETEFGQVLEKVTPSVRFALE